MVNPSTGHLEKYEEVWSDEPSHQILILRSVSSADTEWVAQSDKWQIGVSRTVQDGLKAWVGERGRQPDELELRYQYPMEWRPPLQIIPDLGRELVVTWRGRRWEVVS